MENASTKEKILQASMNLFMTRGYKKTTTKLIAQEAGVNEVTIFRLFGKKKNIVEEIVQSKISHMDALKNYLTEDVTYDLVEDLYASAMLYFNAMSKNLPFIMSLLDELGSDFERVFSVLPTHVIRTYTPYFEEMHRRGIVKEEDADFLARTFTIMIVGVAMTKRLTNEVVISIDSELFIRKNIEIFAQGITP